MQLFRKIMNCQSLCTCQQNADRIVLMFRNSSFTAWLAGKVLWIQLSKPAVLGTYKGKRLIKKFQPLNYAFSLSIAGWRKCLGSLDYLHSILNIHKKSLLFEILQISCDKERCTYSWQLIFFRPHSGLHLYSGHTCSV